MRLTSGGRQPCDRLNEARIVADNENLIVTPAESVGILVIGQERPGIVGSPGRLSGPGSAVVTGMLYVSGRTARVQHPRLVEHRIYNALTRTARFCANWRSSVSENWSYHLLSSGLDSVCPPLPLIRSHNNRVEVDSPLS